VLEARVRADTTPQRDARRAHIVLFAAGGCPAWRIAEIVRVDVSTVVRWRARFARDHLDIDAINKHLTARPLSSFIHVPGRHKPHQPTTDQ
jgi:transposase-like protein